MNMLFYPNVQIIENQVGYRRVCISANCRFVFTLDNAGRLHIWDVWSQLIVAYLQLSAYAHDIALLQIDKASYRLDDIRLLILSSSFVDHRTQQIDERHQQV